MSTELLGAVTNIIAVLWNPAGSDNHLEATIDVVLDKFWQAHVRENQSGNGAGGCGGGAGAGGGGCPVVPLATVSSAALASL